MQDMIYLQKQLLLTIEYKQDKIDNMGIKTISNENFQQLLTDKVVKW